MDFPLLARSRRSVRRYKPRPIPPTLLQSLVEVACWSPSAHNRQPWRFAVITTHKTQLQLATTMNARLRQDLTTDGVAPEIIEKDVQRSYSRITNASALICLCLSMVDMDSYPDPIRSQNEYLMAVQSTAMAGQTLLLAAHHHGLGACWMCAPLFCPDVVKTALEMPTDWQPQALITLGYPAEERQKERQPLSDKLLWR